LSVSMWVLIVAMTGCSTVDGTATTFFESPLPPKGSSIVLLPSTDMDRLEWSAFKEQFASSLSRVGYRSISEGDTDSWYAVVRWGMGSDSAEDVVTGRITNQQGQMIGVSRRARNLHLRRVLIECFTKDPRQATEVLAPVAQVRVLSTGSAADIADVMPALAKMAFAKWPGAVSGRTYSLSETIPSY
jgi:hypothetical protein